LNKTRAAEIEMKNNLEMQHKTLSEEQRKTKSAKEQFSKLKLQNVRYAMSLIFLERTYPNATLGSSRVNMKKRMTSNTLNSKSFPPMNWRM
jgi:hypothetical protein